MIAVQSSCIESQAYCKNNCSQYVRTFTLVVDYIHTMELPLFGKTQPGSIYYYTLISVYNLFVVNSAHIQEGDNEPKTTCTDMCMMKALLERVATKTLERLGCLNGEQ